jgi:hypothetical protein
MSDQRERVLSRFAVSARGQVEVALAEKDGRYFIEMREVDGAEARVLSLPAAMLPELKRAVGRLEEAISERGLSEDFEDSADYRRREKTFANDSEREFAALLDFYRIHWEYEPATFPIRWDEGGNVLESFTPDFYLADFNMFIELTTMRQSLVTRKNRKVRLFQTHYPDRPIRIFYGRDYRALIAKYGLASPARA